MSNDLISRSELLGKFTAMLMFSSNRVVLIENVIEQIQNAPTVEVDKEFIDKIRATGNFKNGYQLAKNYYKRPQGEWIRIDDEKVKCPICEVIHLMYSYPGTTTNFCPSCGADMRGDKNG